MGSKDASQKMQFLGTIQKLASLFLRLQNAKWRKTPTDSTILKQNMSESQCSYIFQEPLNRGKYAYTGLSVKHGLGKSSYDSEIPPVQAKNQIITVSVFLSTMQLTA